LHVVDASADNMEGHEETVIHLLQELNMDKIPRLTVYNKRDLVEGTFFPSLFPNILVSAKSEEDMQNLLHEILKMMKQQMVPYEMEIPSQQGGKLVRIREETLLERQTYDEEKQLYIVEGYAKPESRWIGESKKE